MVTIDKVEGMAFCKGMAKEYLKRLITAGEFKSFPRGSYLFHEGQQTRYVYLLAEGEVALEMSLPDLGPGQVQLVGPNELIGWSPLLGQPCMTASAVALTPCRVLALDAQRVQALAAEDPRFGEEVMRRVALTLARRLNALRLQLLETHRNDSQAVS